ncbi:MAG: acyl carrier protein [Gammaproteobacteria bacterium]|nr:acyl carrier protein [Gammaproteobacteria bacterium]MCP5201221.1 acyl carrier protein [Gammaproteobacteria bacterium]
MKPEHHAIVDDLIALLTKTLDRPQAVSAETALIGDLGLESIQVIEYLCEVEDHFDLAIDEDTLADVNTVGDLAGVVGRLLDR